MAKILSTTWNFHPVIATASVGDLLWTHTDERAFEEVRLDAFNNHTADVELTVQWNGTTAADEFKMNLTKGGGALSVIPDWRLARGAEIRVYASVTAVVGIYLVVREAEGSE